MKSGSTKSETKVARLRCERGLTQAAGGKNRRQYPRDPEVRKRGTKNRRRFPDRCPTDRRRPGRPPARTYLNIHTKAPPCHQQRGRGLFLAIRGKYTWQKRRRFRHLSWNDRLRIEAFLKCGKSVQEIADEIGVHRNTIYNELKRGRYTHRNSDWTEEERYSPDIAEAAYREHLAAKGPDLEDREGLSTGRIH